VNANTLVDLLLELNIVNIQDVDREINKLATRIADPRAQKWFRRVPRFFLINIDRLLKEPYVAKAEQRPPVHVSKYYAAPEGGWVAGRTPEMPPEDKLGKYWGEEPMGGKPEACRSCAGSGSLKTVKHAETGKPFKTPADPVHDTPEEKETYVTCTTCKGTGKRTVKELKGVHANLSPELQKAYIEKLPAELRSKMAEQLMRRALGEAYDPKEQTYTTSLHEPVVQKDIEQSFTPFQPKKAKAAGAYGGPPSKKQLQPWMTAPGSEEKEFFHFDPIQVRRRELYSKLENLVNYLNYQGRLVTKRGSEDEKEVANAVEAEKLMRRLETMKTDDIAGFRDVLQDATNFIGLAKEKPWLFTQDGKQIAAHGNLIMRKVIYAESAVAFSKRPVDTQRWTDMSGLYCPEHSSARACSHAGVRWPIWCTKTLSYAENYLNNPATNTPTVGAALYFIDKNNQPYVLAHFPSHQVYNPYDRPLDDATTREIAPLFLDEQHFPIDEVEVGAQSLAQAVERIRAAG
jgi:hypothetical protein